MKKLSILFAAVAMIAMTACNEKPAKEAQAPETKVEATQQADTAKNKAIVGVGKVKPTEDGKDHTVAEFNTKDYQVRLENLADGSIRLSLWKPGADKATAPERVVTTKKCVMQKNGYLMKDDQGNNYIINTTPGKEEIVIMNSKDITYHGTNSK